MKKLFVPILTICILTSCYTPKAEKTEIKEALDSQDSTNEPETKTDTVSTIWEVEMDTTRSTQNIRIDNRNYKVEIITYSFNDSSITWLNRSGKPVFKDIYHNHKSDIYLVEKVDTVFNVPVTKNIFKDSLESEFYERSIIWNIEYESVRLNRLYFSVELLVPDTDWAMKGKMAIFFRADKKGQIDFGGFENIGL